MALNREMFRNIRPSQPAQAPQITPYQEDPVTAKVKDMAINKGIEVATPIVSSLPAVAPLAEAATGIGTAVSSGMASGGLGAALSGGAAAAGPLLAAAAPIAIPLLIAAKMFKIF